MRSDIIWCKLGGYLPDLVGSVEEPLASGARERRFRRPSVMFSVSFSDSVASRFPDPSPGTNSECSLSCAINWLVGARIESDKSTGQLKAFSDLSMKESVFGNLAHARPVIMQLTVRPAWILTPPTRMGVGYRLRVLTQFNCH